MTPGARLAAAIELLDATIAAARESGAAADTLIARYFATRRYAGSKDRRAVRELVYEAIRRFGEPPVSGRAAMVALADLDPGIAAMFDGSAHAPQSIDPDEPRTAEARVPGWLGRRLAESGLEPVGLALRRTSVDSLLASWIDGAELEAVSEWSWRAAARRSEEHTSELQSLV